ncbi:MAG: putative Ig domain-containing protein [Candidatus Aenigmarchaeota archaeon]|nr:putative Ig domain-containing protein [Candidatus Aenigmarchaeota archaeon]
MKKLLLLLVVFLLAFSTPVFAHTDPSPSVYITAPKQVDTDAAIKVYAEDYGYKSGLVYIELLEDGKSIGARTYCNLMNTCEATYNVHHDIKGSHSYAAAAVDRSDSRRLVLAGVSFLGFDQPPQLTLEEHPHVDENQNINLVIITYDKNKYTVTITTSKLPRGAIFDGSYFRWTPDYDQSGTYYITFTAKNSKNLTTSKTMAIKVNDVNRPPQIISVSSSSDNVRIFEGDKATFSLDASDPDKTFSVEWILDNSHVSSSKSYVYKPDYDEAGWHVLVGRVYDKEYSKRYVWNINVEDVNRPPTMQKIAPKKVKEGETVKFSLSASDPDKDPLNYTVSYLPTNARFNPDTRTFEWKTTYGQAGVYDVIFSVSDPQHHAASATATITVTSEGVDPDFEKLYDEYSARSQQTKQEDVPIVTPYSTVYMSQFYYTFTRNVTTSPTCVPGYLCFSTTYFLRG